MKKMNFNEYQKQAWKTALYPNKGSDLTYPGLKLCGEAGEVAEKIGKLIRDRGGVITQDFVDTISKELGDVLWYIAAIATTLHLPLEDIAQNNIEKLASRANRGKIRGDGDDR